MIRNEETVTISARTLNEVTKLIGTVQLMRTAQKEYFATRNTGKLMLAKGYEADVDAYLRGNIFKAPLVCTPKPVNEYNEDKIGSLVQAKVKIIDKIAQIQDRLRGLTDHQSETAIALHDNLEDLRHEQAQVDEQLVKEKGAFKLFLQNKLSEYNEQLECTLMKPHELEEVGHMVNRTVKKIAQIDEEILRLKA